MTTLELNPPLLNSASPWATTEDQLRDLYLCPSTGAVTTRTCTLDGFAHDENFHRYAFFDADTVQTTPEPTKATSLNTLGYSPFPLDQTLEDIKSIILEASRGSSRTLKPFIISITGPVAELEECYQQIARTAISIPVPLFVEINLSCPNIAGKPPPAFTLPGLRKYMNFLKDLRRSWERDDEQPNMPRGRVYLPVRFGIKLPPYSNPENFEILRTALLDHVHYDKLDLPLQFITATNTLGCCLMLDGQGKPLLSSGDDSGIGGLAGAALHPLALGNVRLIREMLDSHSALKHIQIIGVGGVSDIDGYRRMRAAGAACVAVGTALGAEGIGVFEKIVNG